MTALGPTMPTAAVSRETHVSTCMDHTYLGHKTGLRTCGAQSFGEQATCLLLVVILNSILIPLVHNTKYWRASLTYLRPDCIESIYYSRLRAPVLQRTARGSESDEMDTRFLWGARRQRSAANRCAETQKHRGIDKIVCMSILADESCSFQFSMRSYLLQALTLPVALGLRCKYRKINVHHCLIINYVTSQSLHSGFGPDFQR